MTTNDISIIIDNGEYVALADGFPSLSWIAATPAEAHQGMERLLEQIADDDE